VIEDKIHGFDQDMLDIKHAEYNDLSEAGLLEEEDTIVMRFNAAKEFIIVMENDFSAISCYASTNTHFYTLWSWVVLRKPGDVNSAAITSAYIQFMELVKKLTKEEVSPAETTAEVVAYFNNSRGASTDLAQRQARLDALTTVLSK